MCMKKVTSNNIKKENVYKGFGIFKSIITSIFVMLITILGVMIYKHYNVIDIYEADRRLVNNTIKEPIIIITNYIKSNDIDLSKGTKSEFSYNFEKIEHAVDKDGYMDFRKDGKIQYSVNRNNYSKLQVDKLINENLNDEDKYIIQKRIKSVNHYCDLNIMINLKSHYSLEYYKPYIIGITIGIICAIIIFCIMIYRREKEAYMYCVEFNVNYTNISNRVKKRIREERRYKKEKIIEAIVSDMDSENEVIEDNLELESDESSFIESKEDETLAKIKQVIENQEILYREFKYKISCCLTVGMSYIDILINIDIDKDNYKKFICKIINSFTSIREECNALLKEIEDNNEEIDGSGDDSMKEDAVNSKIENSINCDNAEEGVDNE